MTRVHVWGASGYAAAEAIRLLSAHPFAELGVLESRSHAGELLADHFPRLRTTAYRFGWGGSVLESVRAGEVVIAAGGHGDALEIVPALLSAGVRVIDLSADFRFDRRAAYGLPEWHRAEIEKAILVANPGCYPTAAALALLPLASVAKPSAIVIDAKSGISGAGRNPTIGGLFAEVSGDIRAYGLEGHRHLPEIERNLRFVGIDAAVTFTPHVVPLVRGMLVDAYAFFATPIDAAQIRDAYTQAYSGSSFVRLLSGDRGPSVAAVIGTNDVELHISVRESVVRAICAIDNLGKGAAGQAIQNMNIMLGFPEESGFHACAIVA
jgi:N-acetyl-gamma-glutamyl-phosphate reductase